MGTSNDPTPSSAVPPPNPEPPPARSLTQRLAGRDHDATWQPALAEIEEALVPAFVIEELELEEPRDDEVLVRVVGRQVDVVDAIRSITAGGADYALETAGAGSPGR